MNGANNGNAQASAYETTGCGIRFAGFVAEAASQVAEESVGFISKSAIARNDKWGEMTSLVLTSFQVLLLLLLSLELPARPLDFGG